MTEEQLIRQPKQRRRRFAGTGRSHGARVDELAAGEIFEKVRIIKKIELEPLIEAAFAEGGCGGLEGAFEDSLEEFTGPVLDEVLRKFQGLMDMLETRLARLPGPGCNLTTCEQLERKRIATVLVYIDKALKAEQAPISAAPLGSLAVFSDEQTTSASGGHGVVHAERTRELPLTRVGVISKARGECRE